MGQIGTVVDSFAKYPAKRNVVGINADRATMVLDTANLCETAPMRRTLKKLVPSSLRSDFRYIHGRLFRGGRFSLKSIDRRLEQLLDFDHGFFVELGANDGFTQSNTFFFEIKRGWRGVLVEPVPSLFLECVRRRSRPGNHQFCNACVSFEYDHEYVRIDYAGLMSVSRGVASDLRDLDGHLSTGRRTQTGPSAGLSFGAVARTLTSILDECDAPRTIDLLSLDVEGAELEVLRGIDFERFRFRVILVECRDLDRISQFLETHGYALFEKLTHHDYLFIYAPTTLGIDAS